MPSRSVTPSVDALTREYREWNARQTKPLPICPGCKVPMDPQESEPLYPRLCGCCGMTRLYRMILAITEAWGPEAARASYGPSPVGRCDK